MLLSRHPQRGLCSHYGGPDVYWVQTTMQLREGGTLPFSELLGMRPRTYTFDKFWEIQKGEANTQLKGFALGVAQRVVGLLDLQYKKGNPEL